MAEEAEREFFTTVGNTQHVDKNPMGPSGFM